MDPGWRSLLRQDSAFFFRTWIRNWSQKFVRTRSHFSFVSSRSLRGHFLSEDMGEFRLDRW